MAAIAPITQIKETKNYALFEQTFNATAFATEFGEIVDLANFSEYTYAITQLVDTVGTSSGIINLIGNADDTILPFSAWAVLPKRTDDIALTSGVLSPFSTVTATLCLRYILSSFIPFATTTYTMTLRLGKSQWHL